MSLDETSQVALNELHAGGTLLAALLLVLAIAAPALLYP